MSVASARAEVKLVRGRLRMSGGAGTPLPFHKEGLGAQGRFDHPEYKGPAAQLFLLLQRSRLLGFRLVPVCDLPGLFFIQSHPRACLKQLENARERVLFHFWRGAGCLPAADRGYAGSVTEEPAIPGTPPWCSRLRVGSFLSAWLRDENLLRLCPLSSDASDSPRDQKETRHGKRI